MPTIQKYHVPKTRDPFVNTPLIAAGVDEDTGEERFFISTWNANVGCLSALITPNGKTHIYRYEKGEGIAGCGAYSAVLTDNDTLWLCSDLARIMRLTLSSGAYDYYETGARSGLVFCGMQYDAATHKLLFMANTFEKPTLCAVSFDTKTKKTVHIYEGFTKASLGDGGFANGDGTYTLRVTTGYSAFYTWNPHKESLTFRCEIHDMARASRVISDEDHQPYIPYQGWLTKDNHLLDEVRPQEEKCLWFGSANGHAYGAEDDDDGVSIFLWEFQTGSVRLVCHVPNGTLFGLALTKQEEILAVNVFGELYKYNQNGDLLLSKMLDTNAVGAVDCLVSIDKNHLLGTPFISQRFWTLDMTNNTGIDCGRAATKCGEVLETWNKNNKLYMASYTEGILTEYNPQKPIGFPENPRIVAKSPHGMRPVASTENETCLYYACNHHYGELGCELTRYNAQTGEVLYFNNPLEYQHIISMRYDKTTDRIYGTTTFRSDCDTSVPKSNTCYVVTIDTATLTTQSILSFDKAINYPFIVGFADNATLLISVENECHENSDQTAFCLYDIAKNHLTTLTGNFASLNITTIKACDINQFAALEKDGIVSLYSVENGTLKKGETLFSDSAITRIFAEKGRVMATTPASVYVADL